MGKLDRLIPWQQAQQLVEEAGGSAELLLLEQGNHGCANLAPFHRQLTADWAADQLGGVVSRAGGALMDARSPAGSSAGLTLLAQHDLGGYGDGMQVVAER